MNQLIIPRYCDNRSILLVNRAGIMRKLYCPFRVKYIGEEGYFEKGIFLWVEEVASSKSDKLIYLILGRPFIYSGFEIKASF